MDPYMSFFFMLTVSFPEALVISFFVITFMGGKPRLPEILIIAAIQAFVAFLVRSLPIPLGLHTILLAISYVVLLNLIARTSVWTSSVGVVAVLIVNILTEVSVTRLVTAFTGLSVESLVNDRYDRLFITIPITLVMLTIALIFKRFNITFVRITGWQNIREKYNISPEPGSNLLYKEYLPAVVFTLLPILLLWLMNFTQISVQIYHGVDYPSHLKGLFVSLVIMLAFMSLWSIKRLQRSIEKEIEATRAAETVERLKELILSIRKQRHDFNHQLQAVYGLMETGNFDGAREYIKNTYHYFSGTGELIKTDNPAISALLYTKIGIAETRNIKLDISINCSLEGFPLNSNEASSLLGNLIDNAFDAVEEVEGADKEVKLDIDAERGEYIILLSNRAHLNPHMFQEIFNPNFTTKSGHSGLGLTIVKEIAGKHGGNVQLIHENGKVTFRVNVPFR